MAKKKEGRESGKKLQGFTGECDLDGGYESPIKTFHDLSFKNIQSLVAASRYVQTLIILTVIGIFLRFYNLGFNSLWLDEASTYTISVKSFADIWQVTASGEFNPPLFYWIEHIMLMFGNNEVILRFIPALLGVLTIPLFYLIRKGVPRPECGHYRCCCMYRFPVFDLLFSGSPGIHDDALFCRACDDLFP